MSFLNRSVLATFLSTLAFACAEQTQSVAEVAEADENLSATAAPARGTEMHIDWQAREEIAIALGQDPKSDLDMGDVIVGGVLRIQHQYSVAAVRVAAPSWILVPVGTVTSPFESNMSVVFPRYGNQQTADYRATRAAAEKLFNSLVRATETRKELGPHVIETTRATAKKTLACTKTTAPNYPTEYRCTISGANSVGGSGLFWD
jgi:hypothetical protein